MNIQNTTELNLDTEITISGEKHTLRVVDMRGGIIEAFLLDDTLFLSQEIVRGGDALVKDAWTKSEIKILKDKYLDTPMQVLLQILPNRTPNSIVHKAHRIGLKRLKYIEPNEKVQKQEYQRIPKGKINLETKVKFWTDEEIKILKNNYPEKTIEQLSDLLSNRTIGAIYSKLSSMGLLEPTTKDCSDLSVRFEKHKRNVIAQIKKRQRQSGEIHKV